MKLIVRKTNDIFDFCESSDGIEYDGIIYGGSSVKLSYTNNTLSVVVDGGETRNYDLMELNYDDGVEIIVFSSILEFIETLKTAGFTGNFNQGGATPQNYLEDIEAGSNISIDKTDPLKPIISATATPVVDATATTKGIVKLFDSLGSDIDGAPTNQAVNSAVSSIASTMVTGVQPYATKAIIDALPVKSTTVSYKVTSDTALLNGYYRWSGTIFVKDAELDDVTFALANTTRVATLLNGNNRFVVNMLANTWTINFGGVKVNIGKDTFTVPAQTATAYTFVFNSCFYYKKSTNQILTGAFSSSLINNIDHFIISIWDNDAKRWIFNETNMILSLSDANSPFNLSRKLYVTPTSFSLKLVLDTKARSITIPAFTIFQFSDDMTTASLSVAQTLTYSTTNRNYYLYYDRTNSTFLLSDNITRPTNANRALYFVTNFRLNNATSDVVELTENANAIVVVTNKDSELLEITGLGDSNTFGGGWTTGIGEYLNQRIIFNNMGVNGSTMTNPLGSTVNSMEARSVNIPATTKLLIIMGGTNDTSLPLGTLTASAPYNIQTFIGAYQTVIERAYSINSSMRIVLFVPMRSYVSGVQVNRDNIVNAVKSIGLKYAIPVLDLHNEMGINEFNQSIYFSDQLHLNDVGKGLLKRIASEKIKEIF